MVDSRKHRGREKKTTSSSWLILRFKGLPRVLGIMVHTLNVIRLHERPILSAKDRLAVQTAPKQGRVVLCLRSWRHGSHVHPRVNLVDAMLVQMMLLNIGSEMGPMLVSIEQSQVIRLNMPIIAW